MVYVLKCNDWYKIGVAKDVKRRISEISTGNPYSLSTVLTIDTMDKDIYWEGRFHSYFGNKGRARVREWFKLINEDIMFLRQAKDLIEWGDVEDMSSNNATILCKDFREYQAKLEERDRIRAL